MCWLIAIFFSYWHLDNWVVIMAQRSCVIFLFSQYAIDPLMKNKNTLRVPWYLLGVDSANIGLFWLDMHLGAASSRRQLHNLQEFVSFLAVLWDRTFIFFIFQQWLILIVSIFFCWSSSLVTMSLATMWTFGLGSK